VTLNNASTGALWTNMSFSVPERLNRRTDTDGKAQTARGLAGREAIVITVFRE
jgi:hypothetical protein